MLANFNMYCIRMCLNVTIVAMTHGNDGSQPNDTAPEQQGGTAVSFFFAALNHPRDTIETSKNVTGNNVNVVYFLLPICF